MYRNKILAIFTVMIVILLGVMIWSSNVVADHNAAKKSTENEQKGNVIGVEIPEEHRKDFITEESLEDSDAKSEEQVHDEIDGKKLVIDTNVDVPEIVPRVSSETRLDANYIDKIDFSKKLVLWNVTTFPLNICIKNENNLPEGIVNSIKIAFGNWERLSEGLVKFQYTQDENLANIIVNVPENASENCSEVNGNDYKFNIKNGILLNAELIVPQNDCNGNPVDVANLYAPLQHQVGHILGISAHSNRASDVMYPTPSYENINITYVDVNTLKLLYNFVPNITNKYYTKKETADMIKLVSIAGKSNDEINKILLETINKKRVATSYEVAIDEAYEFYKARKYDKAATKYLEASEKADKPLDKSFALKSLAILYLQMNKNQDAIKYANKMIDISNTPYNQYILAYINYQSGNNDVALARLELLTNEYPKLMGAYPIMAQIYKTKGDSEKIDELVKLSKIHFGSQSPIYYE